MDENTEALNRWFLRVVPSEDAGQKERRAHPRREVDDRAVLVPINREDAKLELSRHVVGAIRNESIGGLAMYVERELEGEYFFGQNYASGKVYLLQLVRHRRIDPTIIEYGFRMLDCFESIGELKKFLALQ